MLLSRDEYGQDFLEPLYFGLLLLDFALSRAAHQLLGVNLQVLLPELWFVLLPKLLERFDLL